MTGNRRRVGRSVAALGRFARCRTRSGWTLCANELQSWYRPGTADVCRGRGDIGQPLILRYGWLPGDLQRRRSRCSRSDLRGWYGDTERRWSERPAPSAGHVRPDGPAPAPVWLAPPQVDGKRELLVELQRVFERPRRLGRRDGQPDPVGPEWDDVDGAALAIRLVLVQRLGDAAPRPVWTVDLISGEERLVTLPADARRERRLPSGPMPCRMACWPSTATSGGRSDRSCRAPAYTGLVRPGVPQVVFQWRSDGVEYEVYQSVSVLGS
jgi:hypothetical protein